MRSIAKLLSVAMLFVELRFTMSAYPTHCQHPNSYSSYMNSCASEMGQCTELLRISRR